jgi:hypothetical protein
MRRIALFLILGIAALSLTAYAATVSVSTATYQAQNGVYYQVTGNLQVQSNGFFVAQSSTTPTSGTAANPCTWTNGGSCSTAVTAGHWVYQVTVSLTATTNPSTNYAVTVLWNTGSGYVQMGQLYFTTPSSITAGQSMTFTFDTGSTSFNAPSGIVITVG